MVDRTLSYLDYVKLLDIFKQYSSTPFIDQLISNLKPLNNLEAIEERQNRIEAILEIIKWDGKIPLSDIPDIRDIIRRVFIKDSVLEAQEFVFVSGFLKACSDIAMFLKKAHNKKPFVETILERIKPLLPVYSRISKTVNVEGFIEDTASYDLSKIRADLFVFRERIRKKLEKIMERETVRPVLQDFYISLRNNRYVIPLKPNFNEVFQGIVHDYSHSLKTSFVEPLEVVELNNAINILEKDEKEEEKRVLRELTEFIRKFVQELETNLDAIQDMDFYQCFAIFSTEFGCVKPEINNHGLIDMRNAVNPFIVISKKDQTIPIDICMEREKKAMIISGPNAGGKTAALKTIGLLSAMAQTGLLIPASGRPVVPLFSHIFAIIGDEQDIAMELSSFTAHMNTIKDFYKVSKGEELILIDEIGGNTEPQEASALSMGVIDAFVEKGCKVIVTTHLNLLKAYGYTKPFSINVATAFDSDNMKPMYKLLYGMAGYSNAINVAKNIDVPSIIIEKSYEYLGKQEHMLNDLVSALELGKRKIYEEQKEMGKLKEELKKRLFLLHNKKDEYIKKLEERCNTKLLELERELEEVKKEVAKKERASIKVSRGRLGELRKRFVKGVIKKYDDIHIGDHVKVTTLGSSGYVVDVDKENDMYEIVIGNVRTKVNKWYVDKVVMEPKTPNNGKIHVDVEHIDTPEINVMGMRVEEALKELDRFIDRAIVQGMPIIKILHGIGTGRLMSAIREHLAGADFIKNLRKDEKNSGVTIVELL